VDHPLAGLRLAVLASIAWPAPPAGYGPWEQVAFDIADGMRRRGLDVTLFATGNSRFEGKLASVIPVGLNEDPALSGDVFGALHIGELFRRANEFDLIHNNFDWKPLTYALSSKAPPLLTTVHGFSSPQILAAYYASAWRSFFCSISNSDRDPGLDYLATTYNGVDPKEFTFEEKPGEYLVFLGRFHPEKGTHLAIEIAERAGVRLKMAAIPQDETYFREQAQRAAVTCASVGSHDDAPGALRHDDDRSDGVRHAGARRAHGLDSGNRRRRRHGLSVR
jgi:glycosyltransferase involved in cell wall biosynthesis